MAREAFGRAFQESGERWLERMNAHQDKNAARQAVIEPYLSATSRDNPGESCPVAAFVGDMCHEATDSALRQTFVKGIDSVLDTFAPLMDSGDPKRDRQQALVQYALMVGALTLARATRGDELSDEILQAAQSFLTTS